jgi:hypothetical protein
LRRIAWSVIIGLLVLCACQPVQPAAPDTPTPSLGNPTEVMPSDTPAPTPEPSATPISTPNPRQTLVGAIRWDAWVGEMPTFGDETSENRVGLVVERTLGPQRWHYRLPFFGVELGENQVQARGASQEIIDQEIAYASQAGLDYWAFVYYPPGSGLDTARNLYLSSEHRDEINFSLIYDSPGHFKEADSRQLLVDYFKLPNYQKVLDGRPLLFVFGNNGLSKEGIDLLRGDTLAAGLPTPYIVYMGWSPTEVKANLAAHGLDAGSAYAQPGNNGQPFAELSRAAERGWDHDRRAGIKVVPWVTTGWDPRPRVENPTPWVTYPENQWAEQATPEEIASHLLNALQWAARYPDVAEANVVLFYAWNEFDEGGWLCPTLFNGTDRLDAIRDILR